MKCKLLFRVALMATALISAACGSGGGSDDAGIIDPRTEERIAFIGWADNPEGEIVKDWDSDRFKFTAATPDAASCLFEVRTNSVVLNYCQAVGQPGNRYLFVDRYIDVRLTRRGNGACDAALIDALTNQIVNVFFQGGRMYYGLSGSPALDC
jgi:hypothetical protein